MKTGISFILTALSLFAHIARSAPATTEDDELRQLTEENFRASTSRGLWLVEHYSPKCGHCRHFAPTWRRLAEENQHLERLSGFYMAQVNCLAQGDLCNRNEIKYYPQLVLYSNGTPLPSYAGDRSYEDLTRYINEESSKFAQEHLSQAVIEEHNTGFNKPNPNGQVADVDEEGLTALTAQGPVIVDYFAPWCPHCKQLAPTYEKLAAELKDKINIATVNCEAHKSLCKDHGIKGFPTIRMVNEHTNIDYNGPRSIEKMKEFAMSQTMTAALESVDVDQFKTIVKEKDAFFLYLQNFDTAVSDASAVKAALSPIANSVSSYTSADARLYEYLRIANPPPSSSLLAFSSHSTYPTASLAFPADQKTLEKFVNVHRYPTLTQLSASNYNKIFKSDTKATIVLGALHRGEQGEKEKQKFYDMARAWKRGGRTFSQPVWFVAVEGDKWSSWLRKSYNIRKQQLPAAVVIDPSSSEYYDTTIEGHKITFDGSSIFSVLEGFYQHFLIPKRAESAFEWGSRSATMTLINLSHYGTDNPFLSFLAVVGGVGVFVYLLQKCVTRDPREGKEHHGGPRLD